MSTDQKAADRVPTGSRGRLAQVIATRGGKAAPEAPFVIEHREALIYIPCPGEHDPVTARFQTSAAASRPPMSSLTSTAQAGMRAVNDSEHNKPLIRCLVEEAVDPGNPQVLDEVAAGEFAVVAGRWIGPFPDSSPDFRIEIVDLIADGEKAAAHFRCCGTHLGMDGLSADRPPLPPGYSDLFRRNGWRLVTLGTGSSWSSEESVRARGMYLATGLCALRP